MSLTEDHESVHGPPNMIFLFGLQKYKIKTVKSTVMKKKKNKNKLDSQVVLIDID